eukprot:m.268985 g.268985  ORF g.268985 m.268985 type:complete len:1095 (+) comp16257_c0_seq14:203-3487(+)
MSATPPAEPVLPVDEIQGDIFLGFNKRCNTVLVIDFKTKIRDGVEDRKEDDINHIKALKTWIKDAILPNISTTKAVIDHRNANRANGYKDAKDVTLMNAQFSYNGIAKLLQYTEFDESLLQFPESSAFRVGAAKRGGLFGDHPETWIFGKEENNDMLLNLAADDPSAIASLLRKMGFKQSKNQTFSFAAANKFASVVHCRNSDRGVKGEWLYGHEHFGFQDGLSQPEIRGRYKDGENEKPIVTRYIQPNDPRAEKYSKPGFELLDTGHFLLGMSEEITDDISKDEENPFPDAYRQVVNPYPDWCKNGTFAVYREMEQKVPEFWKMNLKLAKELMGTSKNLEITEQEKILAGNLAALCFGRWWDGTPISFDTPLTGKYYPLPHDAPNMEEYMKAVGDKSLKNGFDYDKAQDAWPMKNSTKKISQPGNKDGFKKAGGRCPFGAHIRKVNPRDGFTDVGSDLQTLKHRLIRRSNNYGDRVPDVFNPGCAEKENRGLSFFAIQANIEDGFEFVQRHWANSNTRPIDHGDDLIIGLPERSMKEVFFPNDDTLKILNAGLDKEHQLKSIKDGIKGIQSNIDFIKAVGMGYFMLPTTTSIKTVLCADVEELDGQKLYSPPGNQNDFRLNSTWQQWDWIVKSFYWQSIWASSNITTNTGGVGNIAIPAMTSDLKGAGIAYRLKNPEKTAKDYDDLEAKTELQFRSTHDLHEMAKLKGLTNEIAKKTISWGGFPKRIKNLYKDSNINMYAYADEVGWPAKDVTYRHYASAPKARQQDEYCEWFTHRDPDGNITALDISAEAPEYWALLFQEEPETALALYQKYVSPLVKMEDLRNADGSYDMYNKWNTSDGIMHLNCPPNSLFAELYIAAECSTRWSSCDNPGVALTEGNKLIDAGKYGLPTRNSDPTIGYNTNTLIREDLIATIANPVGLTLQDLNSSGWTTSDNTPVDKSIINYLRGSKNQWTRIRVEFPKDGLFIGGEKVVWGGQLIDTSATVQLVAEGLPGRVAGKELLKANLPVVPCKDSWNQDPSKGPIIGPDPVKYFNPLVPQPAPPPKFKKQPVQNNDDSEEKIKRKRSPDKTKKQSDQSKRPSRKDSSSSLTLI